MSPLRTTHDPRVLNYPYLAKVIRYRNNQDFWNSCLSGITKFDDPQGHPKPLAHLRIRAAPRPPETTETYGLLYTPPEREGDEPKYTWGVRRLIPTPDPALRALKPMSQETPMFPAELKAHYSSHQPTTFVHLGLDIRPRLFGRQNEPLCGIFFPLTMPYVLLNRIFSSDADTVGRYHDRPPFPHPKALLLDQLMREDRLKGSKAPYTEILARLRMYNSNVGDPEALTYIKPGLLVCAAHSNKNIFLHALLITLRRAFDLMFCLKRKFPTYHREPIPILLYQYDAEPAAQCFCGPWFFNGIEDDIPTVIAEFLGEPTSIDPMFNRLYSQIIFQQGLWRAVNRADGTPLDSTADFDSFLKTPPPPNTDGKSPIFYVETLRGFVQFFARRGEVPTFHEYFRNLIAEFTGCTPREQTLRYERAGLEADFGRSSYPLEPKIHPQHSFEFDVNHIMDGKLQLVQAVRNNDRERFDAILRDPIVQVNKKESNKFNAPALSWAVELERTDMVRALLARDDIDVNITSTGESGTLSPLFIAIGRERNEIFDLLLADRRININLELLTGNTPLMRAAIRQRERMFNALLERRELNINKVSIKGDNILMIIMLLTPVNDVVHRMLNTVILDLRLDINAINVRSNEINDMSKTKGYTALTLLAKGRTPWIHEEAIDALLSRPDLDVNLLVANSTALIQAAYHSPPLVQKLLDVYGVDKLHVIGVGRTIDVNAQNADGQTAFDLGKIEVKRMILAYKGINNIPFLKRELDFLKSDPTPNCEKCGKTLFPAFRHHCRRCIKAICSGCTRTIGKTKYCLDCAPLIPVS